MYQVIVYIMAIAMVIIAALSKLNRWVGHAARFEQKNICTRGLHSRLALEGAIGIHDVARVEPGHACDVISAAAEFMVRVTGIEARPYV
jgi:hypothetical protein